MSGELAKLQDEITGCRACPRLVEWRERVAREKRAMFMGDEYWGKPVPGFGDPAAQIVVVGLAPAAHGANRTGRVFTGDRSGDWLFRSMHTTGLANQPTSESRDDGLELTNAYVTAAVRCAPPANKPTPDERDSCAHWLISELGLLPELRVAVVLGSFGYQALWTTLKAGGRALPTPRPKFGHGVEIDLPEGAASVMAPRLTRIVCSFHPSQQNTFTGRLTEPMLDGVFARAVELTRR